MPVFCGCCVHVAASDFRRGVQERLSIPHPPRFSPWPLLSTPRPSAHPTEFKLHVRRPRRTHHKVAFQVSERFFLPHYSAVVVFRSLTEYSSSHFQELHHNGSWRSCQHSHITNPCHWPLGVWGQEAQGRSRGSGRWHRPASRTLAQALAVRDGAIALRCRSIHTR